MILGSRVRERRTALGLSQENLAHRAGVSLNAVHKLEAGRITDPHFSTLSGIAHALGVTVAELVGEEPMVGAAAPLGEASETGQEGRRFRLGLRPAGDPAVTREDLAEHGIPITDAELNSLNIYLDNVLRSREAGEEGLRVVVSLARDNVDHSHIALLATFVLTTPGLLPPEKAVEVVHQNVHRELVASATGS